MTRILFLDRHGDLQGVERIEAETRVVAEPGLVVAQAAGRLATASLRVLAGELATIGLLGSLLLCAVGLWMIWPPLAFVVPGGVMFCLIAWGIIQARAAAARKAK